jgi:hypothetical protein
VTFRSRERQFSDVRLAAPLPVALTGYYGDPHLDIENVPDPEHLPWIDPTYPP